MLPPLRVVRARFALVLLLSAPLVAPRLLLLILRPASWGFGGRAARPGVVQIMTLCRPLFLVRTQASLFCSASRAARACSTVIGLVSALRDLVLGPNTQALPPGGAG